MKALIGLKKLFLKNKLDIMIINFFVMFKKLSVWEDLLVQIGKNSEPYLALKSIFKPNYVTIKEIVNNVIMR